MQLPLVPSYIVLLLHINCWKCCPVDNSKTTTQQQGTSVQALFTLDLLEAGWLAETAPFVEHVVRQLMDLVNRLSVPFAHTLTDVLREQPTSGNCKMILRTCCITVCGQ